MDGNNLCLISFFLITWQDPNLFNQEGSKSIIIVQVAS